MSFLAGLLTLVSFLAPLAALAYTWYRCHRRLHAKGYSRFFITIAFLGILIGCFWFLSRFGNDVVTLFGSPFLWIGLALLLTRVLLARPGSRRAGKRQAVGASVWGWVVTALGSAMTLFFTWQLIFPTIVPRDEGWQAWLASAVITLALSQYWFNIARRTKEAPETLPATTASVLYLRAFDEEKRPFAFGPKSVLSNRSPDGVLSPGSQIV